MPCCLKHNLGQVRLQLGVSQVLTHMRNRCIHAIRRVVELRMHEWWYTSHELHLYCRQELAAAIAADGLLPLTKDDTPASFAAMLKACWSLHPADRPSAQQMLLSLQAMQTEEWAANGHQHPAAEPSLEEGVYTVPLITFCKSELGRFSPHLVSSPAEFDVLHCWLASCCQLTMQLVRLCM